MPAPASAPAATPSASVAHRIVPAPARVRAHAPLALFVLIALAAAGCAKKGGPGGAGFTMPPMPVEVSSVEPRVVRDQFRALGSLQADEIVEIVAEVSASVARISFTEGQPVQRGQVLVRLDASEFGAEAARTEAQREQARTNFERAEKLSQQNVVSVQDLDNARTALKVAQANESFAKARLAKTVIRAPWSGFIGRRRVSPGAYLSPGDVIAELARVDEMKLAFAAPERYLAQLRPGIPVEISTPAYPGRTFGGRISVVDPIIDSQSRTVQLVAEIANPNRLLRPGMSANVAVTFSERALALVVPDEAVFAEGEQSFVYRVKDDSTVTRAPIVLGSRDSAFVEVTGGLEPGALVVKAGHQKLFEGARVMPVSSAAPGGAPAAANTGAAPARGGKGEAQAAERKPAASSGH